MFHLRRYDGRQLIRQEAQQYHVSRISFNHEKVRSGRRGVCLCGRLSDGTEENLALLGSTGFVSRLPANFKACKEVIDKAVSTEGWVPIGRLAELESSKGATYKAREELVEIGGVSYRCVVYHSDSYDRRKQKAIESEVKRSLDDPSTQKTIEVKYYCREDAIQACLAANRQHSALHEIRAHVVQRQSYRRGRPPKEGPRATRVTMNWN